MIWGGGRAKVKERWSERQGDINRERRVHDREIISWQFNERGNTRQREKTLILDLFAACCGLKVYM